MLTADEALTALLGCLEVEYADDAAEGMRIVAQPGENLITDWCSPSCSMAYVRLDGMGVSTAAYPSIDAAPSGRVGPLAATFHIGVARCVSVMQDGQRPPTVAEQTAEARQFLDDARRLRKAVRCCLADTLGSKTTLLGRWTPQGPLGGCAGGFWPVTVRVS